MVSTLLWLPRSQTTQFTSTKLRNGRYLGRTENASTSVLGHLQFTSRNDKRTVETYNIGPDSTLDVDPRRKEVLDEIPVEAQLDMMQLEGIAIVPDSSIGGGGISSPTKYWKK